MRFTIAGLALIFALLAKQSYSQGQCLSRPNTRHRCPPERDPPSHRQPPQLSAEQVQEGTSGPGWNWRTQVDRWALNDPGLERRAYQTGFDIVLDPLSRIGRLSVEWEPWSHDANRFSAIVDIDARELHDRYQDRTGHSLRSLDVDFFLVSALRPTTIIPPEFNYRPDRPTTAMGHWHWDSSLDEPVRAYVDYESPTSGNNNDVIFKWKIRWKYFE